MRRRRFLKTLVLSALAAKGQIAESSTAAMFREVTAALDETHHCPPGYHCQVLLRSGDPLKPGVKTWLPPMDAAADYLHRFGYNNDFLAYTPLPPTAPQSNRGVLSVNHEFPSPSSLMWPSSTPLDAGRTKIECAVLGHSVIEVYQDAASRHWRIELASHYNRRLTIDTPINFTGPAARHPRLRTASSPDGGHGNGVLGLCAGGKTPWGTVLAAEENFQSYFNGVTSTPKEIVNHQRYGVGAECAYPWWAQHLERFDVSRTPHEPNHFGWIVEIDPLAPNSVPKKHTALGRFRHEAATCVVSADEKIVIYSGDDATFEYLYKYVSNASYRASEGHENSTLLEDGVLYVAQFADDYTLRWLPLVFGHGPLTRENGFSDQGDVLIETRRAADLLGATKLDRPEDVETDPITNIVYALLTNNLARTPGMRDSANPRAPNHHGHILRLYPPNAPDTRALHSAREFRWDIFLLGGDPKQKTDRARYPGSITDTGWLMAPDNCAFDPQGNLWITSDHGSLGTARQLADGLWRCHRAGGQHASPRCFFRAPIGAEVCGPEFTPDQRTLFLAIQHPGDTDGSSYETPSTRWPDFDPALPPRSAILAITRADGDTIGR